MIDDAASETRQRPMTSKPTPTTHPPEPPTPLPAGDDAGGPHHLGHGRELGQQERVRRIRQPGRHPGYDKEGHRELHFGCLGGCGKGKEKVSNGGHFCLRRYACRDPGETRAGAWRVGGVVGAEETRQIRIGCVMAKHPNHGPPWAVVHWAPFSFSLHPHDPTQPPNTPPNPQGC